MTGNIISGNIVASFIKSEVKKEVENMKSKGRVIPCLATVLVGNDPASAIYVNNKQKAAAEVGICTKDHKMSSDISQNELIELIRKLNRDPDVHGILVQLPLPQGINEADVINTINPSKDVDGLTEANAGMLFNGRASLIPCTPSGIMHLLDYYKIEVESIDAVILNRSNLVGKPLAILLLQRNASVMICHSKTKNLIDKIKSADLIVTAVGNRERFALSSNMIKDGAIIIDVGISRLMGRPVGDVVDFESTKKKASWITPVPGGVGPMTIAMLLNNTVLAASRENAHTEYLP
ncbi:MAG TPA: bifunctional 5,10-methylenetetrahydrofolate dehydrogenase/5,10-methenyltetrahydrofolate cyclohydrolase [Nitrososphaeraceae archaeon]|nr:bifunctional 5,10-methylenetetrahydrofolate dehydrogenase/5,10-methenyltetrahydrofolate cyclohydrolase [Nitrososphaeraceae archaeon]